jgi:hypothetical protein
VLYQVVGILWGGTSLTEKVQIRFDEGEAWQDVEVCPVRTELASWALWRFTWSPERTGMHIVQMNAPDVPSIRLEQGSYERAINVDET